MLSQLDEALIRQNIRNWAWVVNLSTYAEYQSQSTVENADAHLVGDHIQDRTENGSCLPQLSSEPSEKIFAKLPLCFIILHNVLYRLKKVVPTKILDVYVWTEAQLALLLVLHDGIP